MTFTLEARRDKKQIQKVDDIFLNVTHVHSLANQGNC